MKKYILKLLCALYFIMLFLPNVMADPMGDFYESFKHVTKNYKCGSYEEMSRMNILLMTSFLDVSFKGDQSKMDDFVKNFPKESITEFTKMIMDDKINPKKILGSKEFTHYLAIELTNLGIKNWVCMVSLTKPGAEDKYIFNVYVDPTDNKLYVANGASQALVYIGGLVLAPTLLENLILNKTLVDNPIFFAHVPIDNYFKSINVDGRKCKYADIDKNAHEPMSYDKFMEEYRNYINSLKK